MNSKCKDLHLQKVKVFGNCHQCSAGQVDIYRCSRCYQVPGVYAGKGEWITGSSVRASEQAVKLFICGLYLFLGLSLLAMCLELMKEEVRSNLLWLGHRTKVVNQKPAEVVLNEYVALKASKK